MSTIQKIESISALINILKTKPQQHYQSEWFGKYYIDEQDGSIIVLSRCVSNITRNENARSVVKKIGCNTTMCAAGWLAYIEDTSVNDILKKYKEFEYIFYNGSLTTKEVIFYFERDLDNMMWNESI